MQDLTDRWEFCDVFSLRSLSFLREPIFRFDKEMGLCDGENAEGWVSMSGEDAVEEGGLATGDEARGCPQGEDGTIGRAWSLMM